MLQISLPAHVEILAIDFGRAGEAGSGFGSLVFVANPERRRPATEVVHVHDDCLCDSADRQITRDGVVGLTDLTCESAFESNLRMILDVEEVGLFQMTVASLVSRP